VAPIIPEWLQTALLTVLLAYVASKALAKGQKQFQKERTSVQAVPQPAVQCASRLTIVFMPGLQYILPLHHGLPQVCTRCRCCQMLTSPCAPPVVAVWIHDPGSHAGCCQQDSM
jgi:hypothetical protein